MPRAVQNNQMFTIAAVGLGEAPLRHTAAMWTSRLSSGTPVFGGKLGACHVGDTES